MAGIENGARSLQYVPLTETVSTLRVRFSNRPDVYVAGDMLVYYRPNEPSASVAPDVFAVFGTTGNHPRDSWIVWREGKAPDFVLEIASESTWRRDVEEKRRIYAAMWVSEYWKLDPTGRCFTPALIGEMLVDGEYRPGAESGAGGTAPGSGSSIDLVQVPRSKIDRICRCLAPEASPLLALATDRVKDLALRV